MKDMTAAPDWRHRIVTPVIGYLARWLVRMHVSANTVTIAGFVIVAGSASLIVMDKQFWAGMALLTGSLLDGLDGTVARISGGTSKFGAVLDSVLDRLAEGAVLLALVYVAGVDNKPLISVLAGVTLVFSFMVSYARSRAEGLGITCTEGWFTRPERVIVLAIGLITGWIIAALVIVGFFSMVTFLQRLYIIWQKSK
jgi:CDP-diacylglycerol--glycerol-3-phosphate 3-phosphatidyltransferase